MSNIVLLFWKIYKLFYYIQICQAFNKLENFLANVVFGTKQCSVWYHINRKTVITNQIWLELTKLENPCVCALHKEINQNYIVFTVLRWIWKQAQICLVQSENGKYNRTAVDLTRSSWVNKKKTRFRKYFWKRHKFRKDFSVWSTQPRNHFYTTTRHTTRKNCIGNVDR